MRDYRRVSAMQLSKRHQTGLTLIELLIGMLVGLIVVAGGINVFATSVRGQSENIKLTRLNQDMRAMMDIMVRDIRRAGFVTDDPANNAALQNNPFFDDLTTGATTDIAIYDSGSCIVYAYNRNNDNPPVVNDEERFGFRLNNDGELEMRRDGTTNENCTNGDWQPITEPDVEVIDLAFVLAEEVLNVTSMATDSDNDGCFDGDDNCNGLCDAGEACRTCVRNGTAPDPACLFVRNVAIGLTGRLRTDTTVAQTITQQVRIRNDKYLPPLN